MLTRRENSKMARKKSKREAYHHGDLSRTLVEKASELLEERGVDGFSLREVARRADVAVAAPSHHFGNVSGLLTAVALEGFRELIAAFERLLRKDLSPTDQVVGLSETYVRLARRKPGVYSIMFRGEILDNENGEFCAARSRSLEILVETVGKALDKEASKEHVLAVAKTVWATNHGLIALRLEDGKALNSRAEFAARCILAGADASVFDPS